MLDQRTILNSQQVILNKIFNYLTRKYTCLFLVFVATALLTACSNSGSTTSDPIFTVSGIVTDITISGAVELQTLDGVIIGSATTNSNGKFSIEVDENKILQGYEIVVTDSQVADELFPRELSAHYSASDDPAAANVTFITTLVSRIASQEITGTQLEKRDAVIQRLTSIGMIAQREWNDAEPASVTLNVLRQDISKHGFETVMTKLVSDLQDGDVNADNMRYFSRSHGSIVSAAVGQDNNTISVFSNASGASVVQPTVIDNTVTYTYELVNGPYWVSIDQDGGIFYSPPVNATIDTAMPVTIRIVNSTTGYGVKLHKGT